MKFANFPIFISIMLFCTACGNEIRSKKDIVKSQDYQREIILHELKGDTLEIVSTSRKLFFPFGQFTTLNELLSKHPLVLTSQYKSRDSTTIYQYTLGRNTLRFILTEDGFDDIIKMMIVDAEILDNKIKIWDKIYVGMDKKELLFILYGNMPQVQIDKINSVTLISGLVGVWYYYAFSGNKLYSIIVRSDYSID